MAEFAAAEARTRGLINPQPASARFGTPISDGGGALFYRVYLSRNPVIAERRYAASSSPRRAGAARDHSRAAVAARSHGQDLGAPGG